MPTEDDADADLSSGQVAAVLRVSQSTVLRIDPVELAFRTTPKGQRIYQRSAVNAYGLSHGDGGVTGRTPPPDGRKRH